MADGITHNSISIVSSVQTQKPKLNRQRIGHGVLPDRVTDNSLLTAFRKREGGEAEAETFGRLRLFSCLTIMQYQQ